MTYYRSSILSQLSGTPLRVEDFPVNKWPKEPAHPGNLYAALSVFWPIGSIIFPAIVLATLFGLAFVYGLQSPNQMVKAGALIQLIGFTYLFFEEFWWPTPARMGDELMADPLIDGERSITSDAAKRRLQDIVSETVRIYSVFRRVLEFSTITLGTLLNAYGEDWFPTLSWAFQ